MSNPRNLRFYDDLDYHGTTYQLDGSIVFTQVPPYETNHSPQIGLSCTLTGSQTAGLGANGGFLLGKIRSVEADLNGAVQDQGFVKLAYPIQDGTAPIVGSPVAVDGTGKVVKAAAGQNRVVSIDPTTLTCIIELL